MKISSIESAVIVVEIDGIKNNNNVGTHPVLLLSMLLTYVREEDAASLLRSSGAGGLLRY